MYDRVGARGIVLVAIAAAMTLTMATAVVTVVWLARYVGLSTRQSFTLLAIVALTAAAAMAAGLVAGRRGIRGLMTWSGDGRNRERAPRAWHRVVRAPHRLVMRPVVALTVLALPVIPITVAVLDQPAWFVIPATAALAVAIAAAYVLIVFGLELLFRPMLEDIAAHLPADFEPTTGAWRLRTKAVAPLPAVTLFAALTVGAFVDSSASGAWRFTITLGIALVIVAVAGAIFLIVTRSVLDPLDELSAATRRVRAGDLSTPVPVVTADDLGSLASDFNRMLVGLRERESLQEHVYRQAEELRASRARIVAASDASRQRVERDLHDGAQQHLVLLNLKLGLMRRMVDGDPAAEAMAEELQGDLTRALQDLRDLAHGIYPVVLENEGLAAALAQAVQRAAIPAQLEADGSGRYPPELEAAVYFCCLEALQNAAKHAGEGACATVRLDESDAGLRFEVTDDGAGYDQRTGQANAGVQNMSDRIGALGGSLDIRSAPGQGTTVTGTIPVGS